MNGLDWNLLRSFVAVAEQGSLSRAARVLGSSQPTVGRHVQELEDALGTALFARHPRGLRLTDAGAALFETGEEVRAAVDRFALRAGSVSPDLDGTVRVTASEVVSLHVLPEILADLRHEHPGLDLELSPSDRTANLMRRDADIAVRMVEPTQPDLVARKVAEAPLGLFVSEAYLKRHGTPAFPEVFGDPGHTVVGFDRDDLGLRALGAAGVNVRREDFRVRCDAQSFHVHAAASGLAVAAVQTALGRRLGLIQLDVALALPALQVWLVTHRELRRNPRVRTVHDALAEGLAAYYGDAA